MYPIYHLRVVTSFRSYESQKKILRGATREIENGKTFLDPASLPGSSFHRGGISYRLGPRSALENHLTFNQWNNLLNLAERHGLHYQLGDWDGRKKFYGFISVVQPSTFGSTLETILGTYRNVKTSDLVSLPPCSRNG